MSLILNPEDRQRYCWIGSPESLANSLGTIGWPSSGPSRGESGIASLVPRADIDGVPAR